MIENVLSKTDLSEVEKAIYKCRQAEQLLTQMDQCGMECTDEKLRCAHLLKFLELVQQNFPLKVR